MKKNMLIIILMGITLFSTNKSIFGHDKTPVIIEFSSTIKYSTPFDGKSHVFLTWEANSESNIDHYEIWWSPDDINYENISGSISKLGAYNEYLFEDPSPSSGINYYMLKVIMYSGPDEIHYTSEHAKLWTLILYDYFNGTKLDESLWMDCHPWMRSYQQIAVEDGGSPGYITEGDNLEFDNGILKTWAKDDGIDDKLIYSWCVESCQDSEGDCLEQDIGDCILEDGLPNRRDFDHTYGIIYSKQRFKFGYYEMRFRVPVTEHLWPAFWMYGKNAEEIDFFEMNHVPSNCFAASYHFDGETVEDSTGEVIIVPGVNFVNNFNIISGEWNSSTIMWYVNGDRVRKAQYPILSKMAIIGGMGFSGEYPPTQSPFEEAMEIDYIKGWKKIKCDETVNICNLEQDYDLSYYEPSVYTGGIINVGGQGCDATISSIYPHNYLSLYATDKITLKEGFHANNGSNFKAKIVPCPSMRGRFQPSDQITTASNEKELLKDKFITVYPNPNISEFTVSLSSDFDGNEIGLVEVNNILGEVVFKKINKNSRNLKINISNHPKGIYFVKVKAGEKMFTEKIICQ